MGTAEIISVGTEILLGQIADTNAQHLGGLFADLGIRHVFRQTVGDNLDRLTEALRLAFARADVVLTIGGLGPTEDDLTRDGIAAALGEELILDPELEERLRKMFAERKLAWTEAQLRQCMRPPCSRPIENPNGTAVGLICEKNGLAAVALPGPRGEFVPMADGPVREYLSQFSGGQIIHSKVLRISGMGESMIEEKIRPLLNMEGVTVAPYAKVGEVHLRLTAIAPDAEAAEKIIEPVASRIKALLGGCVYGENETTLEEAVVRMLEERRMTLSVAESMTGGGLGERITRAAGSSEVFLGGIISYDPRLKANDLGVDPHLLDDPKIGPVSAEVAGQMAEGARKRFISDYAIGITGNAGPTSDKGDKPVGLVYIGVAGPSGVQVEEYRLRGIREDIRARTIQLALTLLRGIV